MTNQFFFPSAFALALALASAMPPAGAEIFDHGATVAPDAHIALSDVRWMEKAVRAGIAEVEAGKLAAAQGKRDEVRDFGKTIADQYGTANGELIAIAAQKRVLLPTKVDRAHFNILLKLAPMSGDAFDKEYLRTAGIDDHTDAAKLFEDGVANLKDPDLQIYARKTLAMIKQQFEMAREMNPRVNVTNPAR